MGQLDAHFRDDAAATEAGRPIPGRVVTGVLGGAGTRSVVVEIGEVTIDLGEVAPAAEACRGGRPRRSTPRRWSSGSATRRSAGDSSRTLGLVPA